MTDRESLPLIFPRAFPLHRSAPERGRNWHLSCSAGFQPVERGGCQGFKGPAPSTLLDELSETSFHGPCYRGVSAKVPGGQIFFNNENKETGSRFLEAASQQAHRESGYAIKNITSNLTSTSWIPLPSHLALPYLSTGSLPQRIFGNNVPSATLPCPHFPIRYDARQDHGRTRCGTSRP